MYRIIFICMLISSGAKAQIQFWTRDEIIDNQLRQARKEMKIKKAYNYVTSENWRVKDSADYNEIFEYDREGRLIVYSIYKTDWSKNKKYFQRIDSFFYNGKGVFTAMKRYTPSSDGSYYSPEYAAKSILNSKGQITRINYYEGYGASELNDYHVYTYDVKNQVTAVSAFDEAKKKTAEWKLTYDKNGRVTKVRFNTFYQGKLDNFTDYTIKYNPNGLLDTHMEFYKGKEKQNETNYSYDDYKRPVLRNYSASQSFIDTMGYWYNGNDKAFYRTYQKYSREQGHEFAFAHEFRVYKFEYFRGGY
jgi:hypothetical protein